MGSIRRHSAASRAAILQQTEAALEQGASIRSAARSAGVSHTTILAWRQRLFQDQQSSLGRIELENRRLQQRLRELERDLEALRGCLRQAAPTAEKRRPLVRQLQLDLGLSESHACRLVGQPRGTQRYRASPPPDEASLLQELEKLRQRHPRFGYRRLTRLLQHNGWKVSGRRVYRLCRREGWLLPPKRVRRADKPPRSHLRTAERPDEIWAVDVVRDEDRRGRPMEWLTVIDEATRRCVSLTPARTIRATHLGDLIHHPPVGHDVPRWVRLDNDQRWGPSILRRALGASPVGVLRSWPAAPWQNCLVEAFNARLRDELLNL